MLNGNWVFLTGCFYRETNSNQRWLTLMLTPSVARCVVFYVVSLVFLLLLAKLAEMFPICPEGFHISTRIHSVEAVSVGINLGSDLHPSVASLVKTTASAHLDHLCAVYGLKNEKRNPENCLPGPRMISSNRWGQHCARCDSFHLE
ncbi:uncharacterized protein FYW61_011895 [Anableps anableps]